MRGYLLAYAIAVAFIIIGERLEAAQGPGLSWRLRATARGFFPFCSRGCPEPSQAWQVST